MADAVDSPPKATYHNENQTFNYSGLAINGSARVHNGNIYGDVHNHYAADSAESEKRGQQILEDIRSELFITDPEIDRKNLMLAKGKRAAGTCQWIFDHEDYQSWLTGDTSVLVVSGGPGKGKTMLADSVISSIEENLASDYCLAYSFCLDSDPRRNNIVSILRGLVHQIVTTRKELLPLLKPHLEIKERRKAVLSSPDILWSILLAIASDSRVGRLICVIDGLDECDPDTGIFLARELRHAGSHSDLRVIVFSRPIHYLQSFKQIRLDQNESEISDDLDTYIKDRVEELESMFALDRELKKELHDKLALRAEGTFLWVGFATDELLRQKSRTSMRECLSGLPPGLPAFYERMLSKIPENIVSRCRVILQWAAFARRPLSVAQMAEAIRLRTDQQKVLEPEIPDMVIDCGGIVVVRHGVVTVVHQSARDYLCLGKSTTTTARWRTGSSKANADILSVCLTALESSIIQERGVRPVNMFVPELGLREVRTFRPFTWSKGVGQDETDQDDLDGSVSEARLSSQSPLVHYAIQHLATHAQLVKDSESSIFQHRFFSEKNYRLRMNWHISNVGFGPERTYGIDDRFWLACRQSIVPWMQYLLTHRKPSLVGPHPVNITGKLALEHFVKYGKKLVFSGTDRADYHCNTLLKVAISSVSSVEMTRLLLAHKARINGVRGQWALCYAAHQGSGNLALFQCLIRHGADVRERDCFGRTALYNAAERRSVETIKYLLDSGAPVNGTNRDGQTALMSAVENLDNVLCLLRQGALVNAKDSHGRTALLCAFKNVGAGDKIKERENALKVTRTLLDHGANCDPASAEGKEILHKIYMSVGLGGEDIPKALQDNVQASTEDEWRKEVIDHFYSWCEEVRRAILRSDGPFRKTLDSLFDVAFSELEKQMSCSYQYYCCIARYRQQSAESSERATWVPFNPSMPCFRHDSAIGCFMQFFPSRPKELVYAVRHNCLDCPGVTYCNVCMQFAWRTHMYHRFQTLDNDGNVLETWTIRDDILPPRENHE